MHHVITRRKVSKELFRRARAGYFVTAWFRAFPTENFCIGEQMCILIIGSFERPALGERSLNIYNTFGKGKQVRHRGSIVAGMLLVPQFRQSERLIADDNCTAYTRSLCFQPVQ